MANQRGLIRFIWMAKAWNRAVRSKSSSPRGVPWIFWTSSGTSSTCGVGHGARRRCSPGCRSGRRCRRPARRTRRWPGSRPGRTPIGPSVRRRPGTSSAPGRAPAGLREQPDHGCSARQQLMGDAHADPPAGAGDHRHLAFERSHWRTPHMNADRRRQENINRSMILRKRWSATAPTTGGSMALRVIQFSTGNVGRHCPPPAHRAARPRTGRGPRLRPRQGRAGRRRPVRTRRADRHTGHRRPRCPGSARGRLRRLHEPGRDPAP